MAIREKHDAAFFKSRRAQLMQLIREQYPKSADGLIVLFGAFESHSIFKQERSFYYLTGIEEPACALLIDLKSDKTTLYVPNFGNERAKWVASTISPAQKDRLGFDEIVYLGAQCKGYQCHPFFSKEEYQELIKILDAAVAQKRTVFTFNPNSGSAYVEQRFILQRINSLIPNLSEFVVDISPLLASMRRIKQNQELEYLYKAIDVTIDAHAAVARAIAPGKKEYEMQALIEYLFTSRGCSVAFGSIVASGPNSTILHYQENNGKLEQGDMVVVDIGAEYNYYNADLSRTFPVSGTFTKRQRELYLIVLETQDYIASLARPGMWVSNKDKPEQSLYHRAVSFLQEKGYEKYFLHGIGHYLGLDVHDVGDYSTPLQKGDVITIEPGIYIPEEGIGIRIEDDYWIIEDGNICLSEDLLKSPDDIELMMAEKIQPEDEPEEELELEQEPVESEEEDFDDEEN
ncbi:aminopeptidase P N-terminal domain-containing protein [Candidatus Dependentiae bacterium]|nr:aminopeptidase P N-terminal domain-containing protein [Candidatus Dependentiae bacterium]